MNESFWRGRRVLVTGHTGFKGGWLALALADAGAEVHGFALAPPTDPSLFDVARVHDRLASHVIGDVRDEAALRRCVSAAMPDVVFHLAAQPLVRLSYAEPAATYAVNVMGTVHLLEAVRASAGVRAVVVVTTDKCYENREWPWAYRENEALGGRDPYSSSKACAELVAAAYRDSFLASSGVGVATARAGNVIGGGDWATDRLLPDVFRAVDAGVALRVRYPGATRPWQHVLEPVLGYARLAEALYADAPKHARAWNFGPADEDARPVRWLLDRLAGHCPGMRWEGEQLAQPHEAGSLKLDSSLARRELGWSPGWNLDQALEATATWHARWRQGADMADETLRQLRRHRSADVGTVQHARSAATAHAEH